MCVLRKAAGRPRKISLSPTEIARHHARIAGKIKADEMRRKLKAGKGKKVGCSLRERGVGVEVTYVKQHRLSKKINKKELLISAFCLTRICNFFWVRLIIGLPSTPSSAASGDGLRCISRRPPT
jgi:hypothetical protein